MAKIEERNGRFRVQKMIDGIRYSRTFATREEAEKWEKDVSKDGSKIKIGGFKDKIKLTEQQYEKLYGSIGKNMNGQNETVRNRIENELHNIDKMTGTRFENYCIELLTLCGDLNYAKFNKTKTSGDYGADIVIELAYGYKIAVQCKRVKDTVRIDAIQEVIGSMKVYGAKRSMIITNSFITPNARNLALVNDVLIIDRNKLIKIIEQKYKNLESIEKNKQWDLFVEKYK